MTGDAPQSAAPDEPLPEAEAQPGAEAAEPAGTPPNATLTAEEVAGSNPAWTVELYEDRIRFLGPDQTEKAFPREGIGGQVDLLMGLSLRRILLAPLRGDSERKDALRFEGDDWEQLTQWIGWPREEDLRLVLQKRTSTGLMIGVVFVVSAFVNATVAASPAQNAYLFVGGWLIGVWLVSRVWPKRILLLLDSGAYAVIAAGLAAVLKVGFNALSGILFVLCAGLVLAGINHYRVFGGVRDPGEPAATL